MALKAPPDAPHSAGFADSGDVPSTIAGWSLSRITAGLWASDTDRNAPMDVLALAAEPGRLALVIDALGPDQRTDALIAQLLPLLRGECASIRLVLAAGAARYANASSACQLELLVAEARVAVTPYGYAVVHSAQPDPAGRPPQWLRCLPGGDHQPAGVLAPSPAWEQHLASGAFTWSGQCLPVRRIPAGVLLGEEAAGSPSAGTAGSVWPDPDRVTIVISAAADRGAVLDDLAELLPLLPLRTTDGVRLCWPRAACGDIGSALGELAARYGSDVIAPVADVSVSGYGGVCHGPMGAAPWLRFTAQGDAQAMSSLYPEPGWENALATADFSGLDVEQVAAGLCLCQPGPGARGLIATARSIIPAPSQATIVVGGDVRDSDVRENVKIMLGRIPAGTLHSARILLTGSGGGGDASYAQFLADTFGLVVSAPAGGWIASPDGWVRPMPVPGPAGAGGTADPWPSFSPRDKPPLQAPTPGVPEPAPPAVPAPLVVASDSPAPSATVTSPSPPAAPGDVTLVSRNHRSSAQERLRYRESAARYQTHLVAVRRVLTQRPGLRSAASAGDEDAVVTDFAAVLDFFTDDQRTLACALRSPGGGLDPRVPCVLSGLRRLPSFTGAVFSSASLPPPATGGYLPSVRLAEPAFVYASSVCQVLLDGNIEYVIWSQTGKRAAALAADFGGDEIVFAAGTSYKVLKAELAGSGPARVFLRELPGAVGPVGPAAGRPGERDEMDGRILERLMAAAAQRDQVASEDRVLARLPGSTGQPIGLDARGTPFR